MRIDGTQPLTYALNQLKAPQQTPPAGAAGTSELNTASIPDMGQQVKTAIEHVNDLQNTANQLTEKVANGEPENTHKAVIAMEHALMALDFGLQVRNKMLEAYQEIMRTQV
ncbi:MAG: flagellar hook-basal body complex protein FliE [Armatimonadota bacterium]